MAPKRKNIFGGKSLSELRKSIGLDKDKSKASTTKQERDKMSDKQKDRVKFANDLIGPTYQTVATEKGFEENFKKTQTPSTFIEDLKGAAKEGLFTTGNKTKSFMNKYGLDASDIIKLRVGIAQGLGTNIKTGSNVLEDIVGDLRREGILTTSGASSNFLKSKASDIFEPGMTKYDRQPLTGIPSLSPLINLGMRGFDFLAGGSPAGMRGIFYGRNVLGLEGEELDNFAASIANNPNLYNQMMTTPEMQNYQLNEFRSQINRDFAANRQGPDDDFVAEAAETPVVVPSPGIPSVPVVPFPTTTGLPTQPVLVQSVAPSLFSGFPQFNLSNYAQQGIANPNLINFNEALSRIA